MKFGDIVIALATLAIIDIVLAFLLGMVLYPSLGSFWGQNATAIISFLLSGLLGGYIFAGQIWKENRIKAIAQISILAAFLVMFSVGIQFVAVADWIPAIKDEYMNANPGVTMSHADWASYERMLISTVEVLNVVLVLALGFIGLYVGSMLRKPKKS